MNGFLQKSLGKVFAIIFVIASFLFFQNLALAAVTHDTASESHTGTTGSANQTSFTWTHTPAGTPRGVLVYVYTISATRTVISVTYGGVIMTEIAGGAAADTGGETGRIDTFFLGTSIPTGAQSIVVNRTNNSIVMYASASTQTANVNTEVYTSGIVLLQENGTYSAQSVTDGSTGVNSLRYAAGYSGGSNPLSAGTGSTVLNSIDFGSYTATTARESTAGQGARNVGFAYGTSDDRAGVHLAVREIPAVATISASPTTCTILSGASTCTVPFTWNITDAVSPNLYNSTTANTYSTSASGTGVSYPITNGSNTVQARNSTTVLASTSVTGSCNTGTTWDGSICAMSAATTLADGTNPSTVTIAPGATITDLDAFSLQTNIGSDTVTAVTVTLSPSGAYNNIEQVDLTDNSNVARCTAVTNPVSNTISFSTCSSNGGVTAGTSATTYKVRITPKSHANMPAVPGASYATTGTVTSFTSSNPHTGTDTASATVTVDNGSPADVTNASGTAGSGQVTTNWTNPVDTDYHSVVVLRRAGSAVADTPIEGTTYTNGNAIGTATVACVVDSPTETCIDAGLINGTAYYYKIFSKDTSGNYAAGIVPTGSPFTPSVITFIITSSAGANGTIVPFGTTNVAEGSSQAFTIIPDSGYEVETLLVNSISVATSSPYTFTNVQANHTISATFIAVVVPPSSFIISANAGTGGTVSPLGSTVVAQAGSQTFTITPNSGYNIATLTVDGISLATSTSYTFTNVQADHSINATFVAILGVTTVPDAGASRPTTIIFSGKAFPGGKVAVIDKELRTENILGQEDVSNSDGTFSISFVGIFQGLHSFGLIAKDKDQRTSQTKFFFVDTRSDSFVEKNILVPPTIDSVDGQVSRGSTASIFGYATPGYSLELYLDDVLLKELLVEQSGLYKFEIPTGALEFGQHKVRTKQNNLSAKKTSDFSTSRTFIVSRLSVVKADLSGDGKVDIRDWSIFLARWLSISSFGRSSIDFNNDGKVNIADFSIFVKSIKLFQK